MIVYDSRVDRVIIKYLETEPGVLDIQVCDDNKDPLRFSINLETARELLRGLQSATQQIQAKIDSTDRY